MAKHEWWETSKSQNAEIPDLMTFQSSPPDAEPDIASLPLPEIVPNLLPAPANPHMDDEAEPAAGM